MGTFAHGDAFILARGAAAAGPGLSFRPSDVAGPSARNDPRLREQLAIVTGRRLSQFSMALRGIRLALWGEDAGSVGYEVRIEQDTVEITRAGQCATSVPGNSDLVATTLLAALEHPLTDITLTGGRLPLVFGDQPQIAVDPHPQGESWQISSEDNLLIVCAAGGELVIGFPEPARRST